MRFFDEIEKSSFSGCHSRSLPSKLVVGGPLSGTQSFLVVVAFLDTRLRGYDDFLRVRHSLGGTDIWRLRY